MVGELSQEQINAVLSTEVVGRIGCFGGGRTYIVPITYVYDGESIYGHSADGLKIRMMRESPNVCFQVDQRENLANWRSVIAWGVYEELHGMAALDALQILVARLMPLITSETLRLPDATFVAGAKLVDDVPKSIIYRIRLAEKTGRFERR
jgi:nitroimidazol reductase NimA-like FMN-containing flavoprotein (pyridoxamine 5'-phosphate oxidase superfamily)